MSEGAPRVSGLQRGLCAGFGAGVAALLGAAVMALRLRCEGFGCTGLGVVWVAWAAGLVPVLALGLGLRAALPPESGWRRAVTGGLLGLMVAVKVLLLLWWARA